MDETATRKALLARLEAGEVTLKGVGRAAGVSDKTVRSFARGESMHPATKARLLSYLAEGDGNDDVFAPEIEAEVLRAADELSAFARDYARRLMRAAIYRADAIAAAVPPTSRAAAVSREKLSALVAGPPSSSTPAAPPARRRRSGG